VLPRLLAVSSQTKNALQKSKFVSWSVCGPQMRCLFAKSSFAKACCSP
jgi:23S rRNA A1618 N6-methylase RlmF